MNRTNPEPPDRNLTTAIAEQRRLLAELQKETEQWLKRSEEIAMMWEALEEKRNDRDT